MGRGGNIKEEFNRPIGGAAGAGDPPDQAPEPRSDFAIFGPSPSFRAPKQSSGDHLAHPHLGLGEPLRASVPLLSLSLGSLLPAAPGLDLFVLSRHWSAGTCAPGSSPGTDEEDMARLGRRDCGVRDRPGRTRAALPGTAQVDSTSWVHALSH